QPGRHHSVCAVRWVRNNCNAGEFYCRSLMKVVFDTAPRALRRSLESIHIRRETRGQASKFRRTLHVADEGNCQTRTSEQGWAGFERGRVVVDLGQRGFV